MQLDSHSFDLTPQFEARAATVKQLEHQLGSQEIHSGALPLETLAHLQDTIKELNTHLTNTMDGLKALSNLQKSTLDEKTKALDGVRFKFFNKSKVATLRKEITALKEGSKNVQTQLDQLQKIQKTISQIATLHTEDRLIGQLSTHDTAKDLATIASKDEKTKQVINHYRQILSNNPHQLSTEQKTAILKAIVVAVTSGIALEDNFFSIAVNESQHQIVQFSGEGTSASARIATFVGEGADAKVYKTKQNQTDTALKLSKPEQDAQSRFQQEKVAHEHLKGAIETNPDNPGGRCIEEFQGVKNIHTGEEGILIRYYDQGSLEKHVVLQQFAETLGITDQMLLDLQDPDILALNPNASAEKMIDQQVAQASKNPKLEQFIDNQLAAAREAGDKTITKNELLTKLTKQLKTEYTPFTTPMRWQMALQIAAGAEFMMSSGIIHGDIKPGNIRWSEGHFVHGDFGTALKREDVETFAKHAATFALSHIGSQKMDQCTSMQGVVSSLSSGKGHEIQDFDEFMTVMQKAQIVTQSGGKYEITTKNAMNLSSLLKMISNQTLTPEKLAKYDKNFLQALENSGLIKKEDESYVIAVTLSPEMQTTALSFFKFLARPANTFSNTQIYSSPADENWIQFSAYSGDPARLMNAIDSHQTFALGLTLIEAITGERPERNQSGPSTTKEQQDKVRADLTAKGFGQEFCDTVIEMVRDQGMDPDSFLNLVINNKKFTEEQQSELRKEIQKVKEGAIAIETSELLIGAAIWLDIDPNQLKYVPRTSLSELMDRLYAACPYDLTEMMPES